MMAPASSELPALYEYETRKMHPLGIVDRFVVGRSQQADLPVFDPGCSRAQFCIVRQSDQLVLETLSKTVPTACNGQPIEGPIVLVHGAIIDAGASRFRFVAKEDTPRTSSDPVFAEPTKAPTPPAEINIPQSSTPAPSDPAAAKQIADEPSRFQTIVSPKSGADEHVSLDNAIVLVGEMLIGRDQGRVQIHLPHLLVSRCHARVTMRAGNAVVTDLNSINGTYVNGCRIAAPTALKRGDRIAVGPYALTFDGVALQPRSRENNVELVCRGIRRVVKNRATGQPLTLLDDIMLVIRPREFVCLLGPSGSGKTTLLSALSARVPADEGTVTINGEDFYGTFDALKHDVAVVPQKDVLHELLSVEAAIDSTAKLRLPSDISDQERKDSITEMLKTVNLDERRKTKIRYLSGGQVKRASLANEIISKPSLLFLDEVTSGLDEQTDREMMELFRRIADGGKTVVCITHSLANVERNCHLVVILTPGGKLAFVGSPAEALRYFQIRQLGDVYHLLTTKPAEQWKQAFLEHPLYEKYVTARMPAASQGGTAPVSRQRPTPGEQLSIFGSQLLVLTRRYLRIMMADTRSMTMVFGQCLLVAILLVILFGKLEDLQFAKKANYARSLLFLMSISCLWFGCNNAAKEIVKERTIYTRERDINLMISSYYGSKVLLLGFLSVVQALVLFMIVKYLTALPGSALGQGTFLALLAVVGVTLGLLISAASSTTDMAVTIVPMALIPQIALANVIAEVEGFGKILAQLFVTAYWGYRGVSTILPGDLTEFIGSDETSTVAAFCVLVLHAVVFAGLAMFVLFRSDVGSRSIRTRALDHWVAKATARLDETLRAMDRP